MRSLFEHSSFYWVRYDRYELRRDANSLLYITPTANAKPEIYNPLTVAEQIRRFESRHEVHESSAKRAKMRGGDGFRT